MKFAAEAAVRPSSPLLDRRVDAAQGHQHAKHQDWDLPIRPGGLGHAGLILVRRQLSEDQTVDGPHHEQEQEQQRRADR
jgi:hypothetical protein